MTFQNSMVPSQGPVPDGPFAAGGNPSAPPYVRTDQDNSFAPGTTQAFDHLIGTFLEAFNLAIIHTLFGGVGIGWNRNSIPASGDGGLPLTLASTTLTSDYDSSFFSFLTDIPQTAVLPAAPGRGVILVFMDLTGNASANPKTLDGNGHNIDSAATIALTTDFRTIRLLFTDGIWKTI